MNDYISRQAAIEALAGWKISPIVLSPIPAADVRENVRGEWIPMFGKNVCNRCGHKIDIVPTNYCPNCGADMRSRIGEGS